MIDLNQIKQRIQKDEDIEKIVEEIDWKEFEELVMKILEEHNFHPFHNFRFRMNRLYEIDVLATKNDLVLGIDCKQWNKGRYKKTSLKYAVKTQKERMKKFQKMLNKNVITKDILNLPEKTKIIPLIVTWFEEDLIEYEKVFIVPIWKLNQFLLSLSEYI
jgi:Holliday junction resolvase-like predicted endonuclease